MSPRVMTDLSALIVALEGATGPSMALSRQIARAIGWHRVEPRLAKNKNGYGAKVIYDNMPEPRMD